METVVGGRLLIGSFAIRSHVVSCGVRGLKILPDDNALAGRKYEINKQIDRFL